MQFANADGMLKPALLSIAVFLSIMQAQAETCSANRVNNYTAVVQSGTNVVSIIGWAHLDDDEMSRFKAKLNEALTAARARDCAKTNQKLNEIFADFADPLKMQNYVVTMLDAIQTVAPIETLGVELTPFELRQSLNQLKTSGAKFDEIHAACESMAHGKEIRELLEGPEVTFASGHGGLSILLPLEDEKAKAENAESFREKIPFNDRDPRIDKSSKKALEELWSLILSQKRPKDSLFDRGVAFAKSREEYTRLKADLKTTYDILFRRIHGAYVRNTFIARNALEAKKSMAIVVGYNHVEDLANQLVHQCKQGSR